MSRDGDAEIYSEFLDDRVRVRVRDFLQQRQQLFQDSEIIWLQLQNEMKNAKLKLTEHTLILFEQKATYPE